MRKLVAGNWKMHGVAADLERVRAIAEASRRFASVDVALCLPATLIERAVRAEPTRITGIFQDPDFRIGAQDVHEEMAGAHTGCISAPMLLDAGATITIVGHSERRLAQCESDAQVNAKAHMALSAGLWTILCVGESLDSRQAGRAVETVSAQIDASLPPYNELIVTSLSIAYEPIWAIGTGQVASCEDIAEMHRAVRERLTAAYGDAGQQVRILYGGSVKASNASEIFSVADVDGALVGGASLTAEDFVPIIAAAAAVEATPPIA